MDDGGNCNIPITFLKKGGDNQTSTIDEQFRDTCNSSSNEHVGVEPYFTVEPLPVGVDTIMTPKSC